MLKFPIAPLKRGAIHAVAAMMLSLAAGQFRSAEAGPPVVRAVLFTSPTCGHCAKVREEVLPLLSARYGSQLQVVIVSTATRTGHELFLSACMRYGLLHLSVPLLVVGNATLVGSNEIPLKFPDLIEKHLAAGGADWPAIPGFSAMLAASPEFSSDAPPHAEPPPVEAATVAPPQVAMDAKPAAEPRAKPASAPIATTTESAPPAPPALKSETSERAASPSSSPSSSKESPVAQSTPPPTGELASAGAVTPSPTARAEPSGIIDLTDGHAQAGVLDRIRMDPYGNGLAILVLAGMLLTLLVSMMALRKPGPPGEAGNAPRHDWVTPFLTLVGLGVAAYLAHVELREVEAVCGPVGDCNTVQQSEYATLFGVLPIGVLGFLGFLAILTAWTLRRWASDRISLWAAVSILGMAGFGTIFSVYLTFLEPFVIGATCLWCLSSAVIMTTIYVLAIKPGRQAWSALARFCSPSRRPPL